MAKLLRCGTRLLRRGARLVQDSLACKVRCCTGGCGPPAECCTSDPLLSTVPFRHQCGKTGAVGQGRHMCVTTYTYDQKTNFDAAYVHTPPLNHQPTDCGYTLQTHTFQELKVDQTGPAYGELDGTNGCALAAYVPVREVRTFEGTIDRLRTGPTPGSTCYGVETINSPATRQEITYCQLVEGRCWDLDPAHPCDFTTDQVGPFPLTPFESHTTGHLGSREDIVQTVERIKTEHTCSTKVVRTQYTRLVQDIPNPDGAIDRSDQVTRTTTTWTIAVTVGWDVNCDGTPGSRVCSRIDDTCHPAVVPYIKGEICPGWPGPGLPPIVVAPAANVEGCDTIREGGWCFKFSPKGPRLATFPLGTIITEQRPGHNGSRTCCECLPNDRCPKYPLNNNLFPCWVNADRNQADAFIIKSATISGNCCCLPTDKLRLVSHSFDLFGGWDVDHQRYNSWEHEETGLDPGGNPVTATPGIPLLTDGVRRDYTGPFQFPQHTTAYQRNSFSGNFDVLFINNYFQSGQHVPGDCQWGNPEPVDPNFTFRNPWSHDSRSEPSACPRGQETTPDGWFRSSGGGWWKILRYQVFANCGLFSVAAEYESYAVVEFPIPPGTPPSTKVLRSFSFAYDHPPPVAGVVCSGGCTAAELGIALPGDPRGGGIDVPFPPGLGGGGLTGGCAGCGGGGGL